MHDSRRNGLLRLKHLREHTEAAEERFAEERQRFERLAGNESAPRVVSSFNLFQTPEPLAAKAEQLFDGRRGRWLEPSAGLGRLYRALRAVDPSSPVVLVDQSPECCAELYRQTAGDAAATLVQADFLECDGGRLGGLFDLIFMNPPFKMGRDVKHIEHAATLLAPGGRLVAFCADGARRDVLRDRATHWERLPAGSFKSEGTNVGAVLLAIDA